MEKNTQTRTKQSQKANWDSNAEMILITAESFCKILIKFKALIEKKVSNMKGKAVIGTEAVIISVSQKEPKE